MPDKDLCLLKIGGKWKDGGPPRAPWSRYIPPCPNYDNSTGGFTKEELDMRRKAYVLNYNQRNSRPKKNDAYIYFSKHPKNKNRSGKTTASNNCNSLDEAKPLKTYPTTASDVPGNVMQLYVNENVPVTMINTVRNYGTGEERYPEKPSIKGLIFQ